MCVQGRRTPALSTAQSRVRRATAGRPEISRDEIRSLGAAVPALSHPHLTEPLRTTRSQRHRRHIGRLGSHRFQQRACAGREALLPRGPRSARSHPGSHRGTAAAAAAALPFPSLPGRGGCRERATALCHAEERRHRRAACGLHHAHTALSSRGCDAICDSPLRPFSRSPRPSPRTFRFRPRPSSPTAPRAAPWTTMVRRGEAGGCRAAAPPGERLRARGRWRGAGGRPARSSGRRRDAAGPWARARGLSCALSAELAVPSPSGLRRLLRAPFGCGAALLGPLLWVSGARAALCFWCSCFSPREPCVINASGFVFMLCL